MMVHTTGRGVIEQLHGRVGRTCRKVPVVAGAEAFTRAGIDAGRRGETLSVREFIALADATR